MSPVVRERPTSRPREAVTAWVTVVRPPGEEDGKLKKAKEEIRTTEPRDGTAK